MKNEIAENLLKIRERIACSAIKAGRKPEDVKLVAVSKGVEVDRIAKAISCGQLLFGENYVQELKTKKEELKKNLTIADINIEFHYIGALQTNKVKYLPELVTMIQSVDRISLVNEIENKFARANKIIDVLAEVNAFGEESKAGCSQEDLLPLIQTIITCSHLKLRGLMTMPPICENPEDARKYFLRLRELKERLVTEISELKNQLTELSMGMTGDFEVAIEEGATMVRVGTGIFGLRSY